jgi:hypothetical protein
MPNLNQTGPMGQGPMTGRRMGRCANNSVSLKSNETLTSENPIENPTVPTRGRGFGLGLGRGGRGRGMGRQNRFRGGQ